MNRVIHFEIQGADPAGLAAFYQNVFGWEVTKWENPAGEYWIVSTGPAIEAGKIAGEPGINGGILPRRGPAPQGGEPLNLFVSTVHVPNVDEYIQKVVAAGGSLAAAKQAIPGLAWLAYCKDPDGNIFGMYQDDPGAR